LIPVRLLKRVLRRVVGRDKYFQAATIYNWTLQRRRAGREVREEIRRSVEGPLPPVLVYQMGKVGSSTVAWALREIEGLYAFQIHLMHPDSIRRWRAAMRKRGLWGFETVMDVAGVALREGIIEAGVGAKIITLVREPIGRNCSFYFQNLNALWRTVDAHEKVEPARLVGEFLDRFNHRGCLEWFDREFKAVLGVDVYEHAFPHDAGHLRIDAGRYDILIMRADLDDSAKVKCMEEFLGVEGLSLAPKNVGSQKPYAAVYRKFLDALELPEAYVDEMLDSKYARHFFSPEEIARLRAKWLRGNGGR
jgi:Putative capsular polysaccharide synthesis protein